MSNSIVSRAIHIVVFALGSTAATAQDRCGDVLAVAYDRVDTKWSSELFNAAKSQACSSRKVATNANVGLSFESLDTKLGLSKQETDAWCSDNFTLQKIDQRFSQNVATVRDAVVTAWRECMNGYGARAHIARSSDPRSVFLTLSYKSTDLNYRSARIVKIDKSNLDCKGLPAEGDDIKGVNYYECRRAPYERSSLVVKFENTDSPNPVEIPASTQTKPIEPKFDLTGTFRSNGLGGIVIVQNGTDMAWGYKEKAIRHSFVGRYYSPVEAIGILTRTDENSGCSTEMLVSVTALSNTAFSETSRLIDPQNPTCGFSSNWRETNTFTIKLTGR